MMHIPYTADTRPDTGVSNATLGIWLFLASEVMLFGALFSSYALLRVAAAAWPVGRDVLSLPLGATNTGLLIAVTMLAWRARSKPVAAARRLLGASALLAAGFVAIKAFEWRTEIAAGLLPSTSTFLAMYFTLTGLHALHVIAGMIANAWAMAGRVSETMTASRIRAIALYWAFVDVVWLVILVLMYLS